MQGYFEKYNYNPKLVVVDNMSLGNLANKPGMEALIASEYTDFIEGNFEDQAQILKEKYDTFDFVWYDAGGLAELKVFFEKAKRFWKNKCNKFT